MQPQLEAVQGVEHGQEPPHPFALDAVGQVAPVVPGIGVNAESHLQAIRLSGGAATLAILSSSMGVGAVLFGLWLAP